MNTSQAQHLAKLNLQLNHSLAALTRAGGPSDDPVARHWMRSVNELADCIDFIQSRGEPDPAAESAGDWYEYNYSSTNGAEWQPGRETVPLAVGGWEGGRRWMH